MNISSKPDTGKPVADGSASILSITGETPIVCSSCMSNVEPGGGDLRHGRTKLVDNMAFPLIVLRVQGYRCCPREILVMNPMNSGIHGLMCRNSYCFLHIFELDKWRQASRRIQAW